MRAFIQVDLDALNLYPRVAMIAGFGVEHVHRGLNEVWAHCYRSKVGELQEAFLLSFFPPSSTVLDALVLCGFLERLGPGRVRVRGIARRYEKDYNARAEAGRKGGQKTAGKLDREGGRFTKQTPSKEREDSAFSPSHQANTGGLVEQPSDVTEEGVCVFTKQTKQTTKQTTKPPSKPPSDAWSAWPSHQADPKSNSLSPSERETIRNEEPEQRTSNATPLGAGRDSRTDAPGDATATRVDIPVVPVSLRPAPPEPYRPPVFERRSHLWAPAEMASVSPPDEQWIEAVVWRMQRLTKQTLAWTMDDVYREQVKAVAIYRAVVQEIEPVMGEFVRLIMLSDMDDLITMGDASGPPQLVQWVQDHAKRLNVPMPEPEPDEVIHVH